MIELANTMRGSRNFCCPFSSPGGENYGDGGRIMIDKERECKYCKNPFKYLAICQNYETRIFVGISGEYLQIFDEDYPGFCDNHKINFCPMCGRKLG